MSFHKAKTDSIPQGWVATPLADLVVTKAGNSKLIKGKMHHEPARHLFQGYSASGADVWSDSFEYDAVGVVVSAVGARCGKSFLAKGKWVAVANTHVVLPFEDAIDPEFLWYGINDEDFWIKSGTAQPFIVVSKSFERLFVIPPRAEQTRIVAKLEELLSDLDAGVAELKAAQKKLAQYRQSLLKAAVEGALTAEWREARRNSPSPQPLSRQGRGAMATDVLNDTGMLTPLPPCGGGVGGEGAKARQVTSPIQQQHARELRSHQTPTERDLWQQLRAKRFAGFKFRRQQPLGRYIVDFVCFEQRLIVELDGSQHADQQDYDAERDAWLQAQGFRVLRFWNNQWSAQPEAVLEAIWVGLQQEPPLPNPSPARGEGLETGAQLLERILIERRARWEAKQLAKFAEQGKTPPKDWQKKYPEPVQPDTTDLPELPQGWVWASLDALIEDGPQNGLYLPASQYGHGTPILRIDDYQIGWHRARTALNLVDADEKTIEVYALNVGDLVINRVNSMTHLGKSLCINEAMAGVLFESNMMRLHLFGSVNADYVTFYLGSGLGRERLTSDAKWAVNQASINQQDIRKTPIPLPPQAEQRQIVELLSSQHEAMERQSAAIGIAFKQSAAQRQNILRAAFAGQLVPQDPNDEPASVLLERIRAERAAVKKPRGRKTKEANHAR